MKNSSKIVVVIILIITLITIVGLYIISNTNNHEKNNTQNEIIEKNTSAEIELNDSNFSNITQTTEETAFNPKVKGLYSLKMDSYSFYLYLYDNGTFKYERSVYGALNGEIGTYVIATNKLILSAQYHTGSDTNLKTINKTITLSINENQTISDKNNYSNISTDIIMKKASDADENAYLLTYPNIQYIIDNSNIE